MPKKNGTGPPGGGQGGGGGGGRMGGTRPGSGPGGFCVCTNCGTKVPHERGTPCSAMTCPQCKSPMIKA